MGNAERRFAAPEGIARQVEELYTVHARLVRSICRSLLRDRNEAEDAVQQTFLSAQRALTNGSSPREPAAWLAVIARNECLARVRERMREPLPVEAEPTEHGMDAYSAAVSRHEVATLREALADLPRAQREAIILRELRGLSYTEVAHALSVTTGAVESLIFRARRTLQVRLGEALTALSPATLLGRLFRGEGDVRGPVVAKVAAIGAGAALLAGGAALGPHAFGLGHAATKVQRTPPSVQPQAQAAQSRVPAQIWSRPALVLASSGTRGTEREGSAAGTDTSSDVKDTVTPEPVETRSTETEKTTETETVPTSTVPSTPSTTTTATTASSGDSGGSSDGPTTSTDASTSTTDN